MVYVMKKNQQLLENLFFTDLRVIFPNLKSYVIPTNLIGTESKAMMFTKNSMLISYSIILA